MRETVTTGQDARYMEVATTHVIEKMRAWKWGKQRGRWEKYLCDNTDHITEVAESGVNTGEKSSQHFGCTHVAGLWEELWEKGVDTLYI